MILKRLIAIAFAACLWTPSAFAQDYLRLKCAGEEEEVVNSGTGNFRNITDHKIFVDLDLTNSRIRFEGIGYRGEWKSARFYNNKVVSS